MDKSCSKCKELKSLDCFPKCKTTKDGYHSQCKVCKASYNSTNTAKAAKSEYSRKYYQENKEKLLANSKAYNEVNIEKINEQRKIYRTLNRDHIKEKNKEYLPIRKLTIKERRKTDENFQLSEILRSKIHKMLSGKDTSYKSLIGCELDTLKEWIEFQFDPLMNWENLGSYWQIDHILPISKFDLNDIINQRICFSWTNLQPLEKIENRKKSNHIVLHYYFNSVVTVHRFIKHKNGPHSGYQSKYESLCWLRKELRYGNNPIDNDKT